MNILLSSYDFHEDWAKDVMEPLLYENMKVVVIPFSFDCQEVTYQEEFDLLYGVHGKHTPYILRPFHAYGIHDIKFIDYFRDDHHQAQKLIQNADILFLTGGLPDQYMKRLDEFGLVPFIQKFQGMIIGASAGAMIQFDQFHITPDNDYPNYHYQKGLGLISEFEVEVHYAKSDVQDLSIERVIRETHLPVYTIANDGGIFYYLHKIIPFGNAHLV